MRMDGDGDGRLSLEEVCMMFTWIQNYFAQMHSVLSIYVSDVVQDSAEVPRSFTMAITRSIFLKDRAGDEVKWSEFLEGFPVAVRQRKALWNSFRSNALGTQDQSPSMRNDIA